jgi:Ca2+-binding RTX toxin-like protein
MDDEGGASIPNSPNREKIITMALYSVSSPSFAQSNLWVANSGISTNERFTGLQSRVESNGSVTETYSTYTFTANGYTYEYEGTWVIRQDPLLDLGGTLGDVLSIISSTFSASGSYNRVTVRQGTIVVAELSGIDKQVNFGSATSGVIGIVDGLLDVVGNLLLGGTDRAVINLHTDASPDLLQMTFAGNDVLTGSAGADNLFGFGGNDTIDGGAGADTMNGGLGDDLYFVSDLNDVVVDDGGNDRVIIRVDGYDTSQLPAGIEQVIVPTGGTPGNDTIPGTTDPDTLDGGSGDDSLDAGADDDLVLGGAGSDVLHGGAGNDAVFGEAGNDSVSGGAGNDALGGGAGNDRLDGGLGVDTMAGGAGDDTYFVDDALDFVLEEPNAGNDTVITSVRYTLSANVENLVVTASGRGSYSGNEIDNWLEGGTGVDYLYGLEGNDTLDGGLGRDVLRGGSGTDVFLFNNGNLSNHKNLDRIADFDVKADYVWLDNGIFKALGTGSEAQPTKLNAQFFTVGRAAKDANDFVIYNKQNGFLLYDADGTGAKDAVVVAKLTTNLKMTSYDLFVV